MDRGLKVGKNNVFEDDNPNVRFSTLFNTFPLVIHGIKETVGDAADTPIVTIKHGLGFIPMFLFFHKSSAIGEKWFQDPSNGTFLPSIQTAFTYIRMDKENLTYKLLFNNGNDEIITVHYFIFYFPIATSV